MTKTKKASISLIVILLLIIGLTIISFGKSTGTVIKDAKLRKEANNTSIVLEIIPNKESVNILADEGEWYQVRYNKIKGYVQKEFIEEIQEATTNTVQKNEISTTENVTQTTQEENKGNTIKLNKETKVYIRPLINSRVVASVEKDTTAIIGINRNGWAYVNSGIAAGWIRLDNANVQINNESKDENTNKKEENNVQQENNTQNENNNQKENEETALNKTAYISTTGINFREEPNTASKVLKVFAVNAKITILKEEGDWYKIKHNDQIGYVIKTYVSEKKVKVDTTSRSGANRADNQETAKNQATNINTENQNTNANNASATTSSNKGQEVAKYVKQFVGCKYVYGGSTPSGFDCSGLTLYVYNKFGVKLPHSATAQSKIGTKIEKENLQPGDLIFFTNYRTNKGIGHVGIYIGNNQFVHASTEKTGVITSSLSSASYTKRFVTATRLI